MSARKWYDLSVLSSVVWFLWVVFLGFWLILISGLLPNNCLVAMLISISTMYCLQLIYSPLKKMGFGFMILFKDMNIVSRVSEKKEFMYVLINMITCTALWNLLWVVIPQLFTNWVFYFVAGEAQHSLRRTKLLVCTQRRPLMLAQGRARLMDADLF